MVFFKQFKAKQTPEWRSQYYDYERAKKWLAWKSPPNKTDPNFEDEFFAFNQNEVKRIRTFFNQKFVEAQKTLQTLKHTLENTLKTSERHHLEDALSEFYFSLILLRDYRQLNLAAIQKIVCRFDKRFNCLRCWHWWSQQRVKLIPQKKDLHTDGELGLLMVEIERLFIEKLANGNRKMAMKRLRVRKVGEPKHAGRAFFRAGIWLGALVVLIAFLAWLIPFALCDQGKPGCWRDSCLGTMSNSTTDVDDVSRFWKITIRLYRGAFLFSLMILLLGINSFGWSAVGINRVLIFELDPRHHLSALHLVEFGLALLSMSCVSLAIWLFEFYAACVSDDEYVVYLMRYVAFGTILSFIIFLINPLPILLHRSRFWLLKCLFRIVTAPFQTVTFPDFWLADQLMSLVPVFQDFAYIICACSVHLTYQTVHKVCDKELRFVTAVLGCLPTWFRFWQCLRRWWDTRQAHPHLSNAGKYASTFLVIVFRGLHWDWDKGLIGPGSEPEPGFDMYNPFAYIWIITATISTVYSFVWDVLMDWGLGDPRHKFLRAKLIYKQKWYYYAAIVVNALLRCTWMIMVADVHISTKPYINTLFTTLLIFVEMFRRFLWNFFRLELEHIKNMDGLRAVRTDIFLFKTNSNVSLVSSSNESSGHIETSSSSLESQNEDTLTRFDGIMLKIHYDNEDIAEEQQDSTSNNDFH